MSREDLPDGENTEEAVLAATGIRVLDGCHRLTVLENLYGADYRVPCRVYYEFAPEMAAVIAEGK